MIVVDIETTGIDPRENSIVSIGALNFNKPSNIFYEECRIWEGALVHPKALEVNGYTNEQIRDASKRTEAQLVLEFLGWLNQQGERMIAGQYIAFDDSFLKEASKRAGIVFPLTKRSVDLHSISYADHLKKNIPIPLVDGKPSLSLDATLAYVGLPTESKPHIAINGAKHEAEAFSRLIFGRNLLPEYAEFPVPAHLLTK